MSPGLMFVIMLAVGILLTFLGIKALGKTGTILMIIGVIVLLIGGYGIFTSLI